MLRNLLLGAAALGLATAVAGALPANAADIYLRNATAPTGGIWVADATLTPAKGRLWVADHNFGFCPTQPTTATNSSAGFIGSVLAPTGCVLGADGEPAWDVATQSAFLPDGSSKSVGIVRAQYRTSTHLFTGSRRNLNGNVANRRCNGSLAGCRPAAVALEPGGDLYIITKRVGSEIYRIRAATGASPGAVQLVASTSDGGPATSLAFVGNDLYIAEGIGLTMIQDPSNRVPATIDGEGLCTPNNSCLASDIGLGFLPLAVGSDGTHLFISDLQSADTVQIYDLDPVSGGISFVPGSFANVSGFASQAATASTSARLYWAADPSAGAAVGLATWFYQEPVPFP